MAQSGAEALAILEKGVKIDLLFTDVVMPGMSGPLLADRLMADIPGLRVLFMSGYDDRQIVQRYVVEKGFALLPKPFKPQTLLTAVREALAATQQGTVAG